ncbi:hypothetical protein HETIRDRAFT_415774 [Heterobasidion irregulare TC 32-1]|uniref:Uncharacterized protein n=1 Tax=Heterobasidion irregulare (strain TC 32-1) TaxID=747525 RepID=W4KDX8_HETIT|nr:uncharacterized protein HETIRDRAFT_415774 [Heterobasidion irregulare TC 32-1]ETW84057.1 hypothetical protein HETIRDRAFT_415774 [Heterobasidion irregulare TC 32-1]
MITHILVLLVLTFAAAVVAIPTWEGFNSRASIGSLVPGAAAIEAMGLPYGHPYYLSTSAPRGHSGNATVTHTPDPPMFFVNRNQLFLYTNDSSILTVNVLNTTASDEDPMPYKITLDNKRAGLSDTVWRWQGTLLQFDHGQRNNQGLYYSCLNKRGIWNLYLFLQPAPTPDDCKIVTLHSFGHLGLHEQHAS